ncbi:MAG TPA: DnaA/Hda family protein [Stellaceae bacterium]|nr:DnaA/Hda family protein [Stellaceae bacterium]
MSEQYLLAFDNRPAALGAEDFLVADCNREAVHWLDRWPDWPAPALTIHGPAGSGKTHLLRVFLRRSEAVEIPVAALTRETVPMLLGTRLAAAVDDAERADPVALLHLFNVLAERRGHLLLTAGAPPAHWAQVLPDLGSRLVAAPQATLEQPDDALLAALLVKLFADRQLKVSEDVVLYCVGRMERSHEKARRLVAELDRAGLLTHRSITIPMVRSVLDALQGT